MDGGAWEATVHGVAKSRTRLSDFTFAFHLHALEKEMATHSSTLACKIPWQHHVQNSVRRATGPFKGFREDVLEVACQK